MLNEKSQTQKGKYHLFPSHSESKKASLMGVQRKIMFDKVQERPGIGCQYRVVAR